MAIYIYIHTYIYDIYIFMRFIYLYMGAYRYIHSSRLYGSKWIYIYINSGIS